MATMTTRTGIVCPHCNEKIIVETEGILGGIIKQMIIGSIINRLKEIGGTMTCPKCSNKFEYNPRNK